MTDPTTARLTDTDLDEIVAWTRSPLGPGVAAEQRLFASLVAEVRRLRATPAALPSIHANDVEGFCPACGHGVLMLGDGGHVVCTLMDCPRPEAADELLRNAAVPSAPAGRAALRDRIAEALYAHSHPGWATRYADLDRDERETYLARADAVLAVLPPSVDRAAVVAEVIARITGMPGYPRLVLPEEMVAELRRMADEAPTEANHP